MTKKRKHESEANLQDGSRTGPSHDPDDDVTSELSDLVVRALGDRRPVLSGRTEITGMQLVSRPDTSSDYTLDPGTLLNDRFELLELIHSGGMGHVYKATDRRRHGGDSEERFVAVKMLRRSISDREEFRLLLEREASKARSLSHPNIINIFDFDADGDRFFLVMEWLKGESLNALLRRTRGQRLSPAFARSVIDSIAQAVQHAHRNNVIHADINPSNIFVTETQDIKLIDFGAARYAGDKVDDNDVELNFVTQSYASPEVLSGLPPAFQDDVFSLGCVAYRLLGGTHPFEGKPSILARQEDVVIDPIPGLSEHEWSVISRSLAYSRSNRSDSVETFLLGHFTAPGARADDPPPRDGVLHWTVPLAAAIVVAFAIGWWSRQPDVGSVENPRAMTRPLNEEASQETSPGRPDAQAEAPRIDAMLSSAREAAEAQQLVLPVGSSARDWYRIALAAEPGNPEALQGLRSISDTFVGRADKALEANDPQAAESALTIALETDAGNPAIRLVGDLLEARGDARLAEARAATANAKVNAATAALADAERYSHIDPDAVISIREQLAGIEREAAFENDLAIAENQMATGQLLEPAGNNALETLAAIGDTGSTDPRLASAYRRLSAQLLARATIASAEGDPTSAIGFLDAADSLDVPGPEIERVRETIAAAARPAVVAATDTEVVPADEGRSEPADSAASRSAGTEVSTPAPESGQTAGIANLQPRGTLTTTDRPAERPGPTAETSDNISVTSNANELSSEAPESAGLRQDGLDLRAAQLESTAGEATAGPERVSGGEETSALYAASGIRAIPPEDIGAGTTAPLARSSNGALTQSSSTGNDNGPVEPPRSTAQTLQDLGLERFVAPKYPRAAKRRGLSGFVDLQFEVTPDGSTEKIEVLRGVPDGVFEGNAAKAVRQWRFEPRQKAVRGNITLRFEIPD